MISPGLIAFLSGLTVLIAFYAILSPKKRSRVRNNDLSVPTNTSDEESSVVSRMRPLLNEFMPALPGVADMSDGARSSLQKLIVRSGNPWNLRPEEFKGIQYLFALFGGVAGIVLVLLEILAFPVWIVALLMGGIGYAIPFSVYNTAKERRAREIQKQLPEALDLLVITMESGMNFEPAMGQVTPRMPEGVLRLEFGKIVSDIASGRPLESTMLAFADRAASDEAEGFAKAVAQAQKLGADVSETLTAQATAARDAYAAAIDKKTAKLPTQMFAYLGLTLIPAFILIFIAPSMSQLGTDFM